jgi:hypothetical protein
MERISERLSFREKVIDFVKRAKPSLKCFVDGKFNSIKIGKKLGSGENVQGDVYKGCTTDSEGDCALDVALKVILPISSDVELVAMDILVNVIKDRKVPNIPLMYMWGKCPDCRFADGSMWVSDVSPPQPGEFVKPSPSYKKYNGEEIPCTTFLCEYAVLGDLDNWLKTRPSEEEIYNVVFQLTAAMATLYYNYGMTHNDIHLGNILVHRTTPGGYWEYFLCGKRYTCPNIGVLAVLWDFGFATMPGVIGVQQDYVDKNGYFQSVVQIDMFDMRRLCKSMRSKLDSKFLRKVCEYIGDPKSSIEGVLDTCFHELSGAEGSPRPKGAEAPLPGGQRPGEIIETYFTSQFPDIAWFETMDARTLERVSPLLDEDMWRCVVVNRGLSANELHKYASYVDWRVVSLTLRDREIAREFSEMIDWTLASTWKDIGEELIEEHISEVDWENITRYALMSSEFMIKHKEHVRWELVDDYRLEKWCTVQILSIADKLDWSKLTLATRTIRSCMRLQEYIDWRFISAHRAMSLKFIRTFATRLVPGELTNNPNIDFDLVAQEFPELIIWEKVRPRNSETLRLFKNKLDWKIISESLEEKYVDEFVDYIDWSILQKNTLLSSEIIDRYITRMNFEVISQTQVFEAWFVDKYADLLDWGVLNITLLDLQTILRYSDSINWELRINIETLISLNGAQFLYKLPGIDWTMVSQVATDEVVSLYSDKLDWSEVSKHATLKASTLWKHKDKINFTEYVHYENFSLTDYVILTGWLNFDTISRHARLPKTLLRMMSDMFNKKGLIGNLQYVEFDWEFFRKYRDSVNWSKITVLCERPKVVSAHPRDVHRNNVGDGVLKLFEREFSKFLKL